MVYLFYGVYFTTVGYVYIITCSLMWNAING